jgi:hypothetical protein
LRPSESLDLDVAEDRAMVDEDVRLVAVRYLLRRLG